MIRARAIVVPPLSKEDRRGLRLCFAAALVVHGGLLLLPMPWSGAEAAPEPPLRVVHRLVTVRPPAPEPPLDPPLEPPEVRPPHNPVPVPAWLADEPPPVDDAALPPPDLETVAQLPPIVLDGPPPPPSDEPDGDDPVYVVGAVQPPVAELAPSPQYPEAARLIGRTGTVVLQATIDREGRVVDLEVLRGAPLGMTEAALDAVRQWRFRPATLEGHPVAVYYHLTVRFETR